MVLKSTEDRLSSVLERLSPSLRSSRSRSRSLGYLSARRRAYWSLQRCSVTMWHQLASWVSDTTHFIVVLALPILIALSKGRHIAVLACDLKHAAATLSDGKNTTGISDNLTLPSMFKEDRNVIRQTTCVRGRTANISRTSWVTRSRRPFLQVSLASDLM